MGLFNKIKNKLGIGGVKVNLQIPGQVSKQDGVIDGKVIMTSKSEQEIIEVKVRFLEEFSSGRGDDKETREFELGVIKIPDAYTIKPGDVKEVSFSLPFQLLQSNADSLKEKGGALGTLGKMSKFANNEKSSYFVEADVDVAAAVIDPSDKKDIKLVD